MALDFDKLQRMLADAAVASFGTLRASVPDETFYAFALRTDGSAGGPGPAANTVEYYEEGQYGDPEDIYRKPGGEDEDDEFIEAWSVEEWGYVGKHNEPFHEAWRCLDSHDPAEREDFLTFRARVYGAMIGALRDVDTRGFFGTGKTRRKVVVFCTASDDPHAAWLEQESARRLNPPAAYAPFRGTWKTLTRTAFGRGGFRQNEAYRRFIELFGPSGGRA